MRQIGHFIVGDGASIATRFGDVFDPNRGVVQAQVVPGDAAALEFAVQAAATAQPAWAATNPQRRARVMFNFKALVEKNMDELAHLLSSEHGKVIADSKGDIQRGLEVIEFCCGIPHALKGEYTHGAGPGIDGWKRSGFGDTNQYGMEGVKFWTRIKTVTQRWPDGSGLPSHAGEAFVIPTMG